MDGKTIFDKLNHNSDCGIYNEPYCPNTECTCSVEARAIKVSKMLECCAEKLSDRNCLACPGQTDDEYCIDMQEIRALMMLRDHVKAEERAKERAEVISKVREWVELFTCWDGAKDFILPKAITNMLDELKQEANYG